jgi:hypothetical protein
MSCYLHAFVRGCKVIKYPESNQLLGEVVVGDCPVPDQATSVRLEARERQKPVPLAPFVWAHASRGRER